MSNIVLPHNNWRPRADQMALWNYLEGGGTRAVEIAHRRWGKDDIALHYSACAVHERVGVYWHMLPEKEQARKAIWEAVNPRTGMRRIDEAFPQALRKNTRDTDMFIRFKNGSTWQVVGSDRFNALMGSPPIGVTFSEWALADPRAWQFIRPILDENGGWAAFITTPRGRNHAYRSYELAKKEMAAGHDWFAELNNAHDTPVFTSAQLEKIKQEMIEEMGDDGESLFRQECEVDFSAGLIGSFYASFIEKIDQAGQIVPDLPFDKGIPVQTAWDLGYSDDVVVWFFQYIGNEYRILDHYSDYGKDVPDVCKMLKEKAEERGWTYGDTTQQRHWVPWDARPKTMAAAGKSILEQAWQLGVRMSVVPNLSREDGIQAARKVLPKCWFDETACEEGLDALREYKREWDPINKAFRKNPVHNRASHTADAFRMLALAHQPRPAPPPPKPKPIKGIEGVTLNRLFKDAAIDDSHENWRV